MKQFKKELNEELFMYVLNPDRIYKCMNLYGEEYLNYIFE